MSDFKFNVGDYVTLKAHVDLFELHEVVPLVVNERLAQQCEGGEQRSYLVRPIIGPSRASSAGYVREYDHLKESELVPLDVEAYRKALAENAEVTWRTTAKRLNEIVGSKPVEGAS